MIEALHQLGVEPGDALFVHSSFKSLGVATPEIAIAALQEAVGPKGVVLMPAFNLIARPERAARWEPDTTPSTTGWLTEVFRRMPESVRSDHYSHSVAARGHEAEQWVQGHRATTGLSSPWDLAPWGKTFGDQSPFHLCYAKGAKLLLLGTDYETVTFFHYIEALRWAILADPQAPWPWIERSRLGAVWENHGPLAKGQIGQAESRLFAIEPFVDTLLAELSRHPERYRKGQPPA